MPLPSPRWPLGTDAQRLYDLLPVGVCIVAPDGRYLAANAFYCRYLGYAQEELLRMTVSDITHPGDRVRDAVAMQARMQGPQTAYDLRKRYIHRDGRVLWQKLQVTLVRDADGRALYSMAVMRDIEDLKQAELEREHQEARFRTITDAMPQMVWSTRPDGFHDYYNQQWYDFTGMPPGSTDGERWSGMFHPDDQERAWAAWRHSLATGETYEIRYRLRHRSGEYRWVLGRALPVRDGDGAIVRWMGTCTDIHAQKLAEDELRRSEQELQEADRRKDEFLAMLAHELRNPLAPIGAAAALLKGGRLGPARVAHVSDVIGRQVNHMTALVNDLLDVSRVTRGIATLDMAPLNARRVVADSVDQVRPIMEARRHTLQVEADPQPVLLLGDHKRLVQVLVNLLNNAAKYTREGGRIRLAMQVQDGQLAWTVSDDGIGMAPDLVERAFDLFTQAQRTADRSQGGLGIGLALVKSLVELHHGSVTARSDGLGRGSEFRVTLPLAAGAVEPPPSRAAEGTPARDKGLRVLVVDDNVDAATLLAMVLEDMGHEVLVEHDSAAALRRAIDARPDVCLLDIGLPDIDGNALARQLRALPETSDAVLVAVTGYGQDRDREESAAAGFHHHFMKPVDPAQLGALLACVERRQASAGQPA